MRRSTALLATTALTLALPAHAQVSVPLPGGRGSAGVPAAAAPPPSPVAPAPAGQSGTSVPLPGHSAAPTPPIQTTVPMGPYGRPDINPYDRDIALTVPLTYRNRSLGDLPVLLTRDDRFVVETATFLKLIDILLNDAAKDKLAAALAGKANFTQDDINATGISLAYDPSTLSVVVLTIAPDSRLTESLFSKPREEDQKIDLQPAHFSAYLNFDVSETKFWNGTNAGIGKPAFYVTGGARVGPVVAEADVALTQRSDLNGSGYTFYRNYVRLVYDQPDEYRRWYLGDLNPEIRGQQTYVEMGGIGVSRQRERFDNFQSATLQGDRKLVLQRASTVDVYRNGSLLQQFHLEPGSYDLSHLPLSIGSNNLQVRVQDDAGNVQTMDYRSYLDPIDLQPGDYEYAAYLGKVAQDLGQSPHYDGGIAFSGFYRKAFLNAPALGVGLQASRRVQVVTGQTQFILPRGARLQLDGGVSETRGQGFGYSATVAFDKAIDRSGLVDSFSLQATYLSKKFGGLTVDNPENSSAITLDAEYSRAITRAITVLFSGSYLKNRGDFGNSYRAELTTSYQFSPKWSIRGGVNYSHYGISGLGNGLGVQVSLVFQPNYRDRAEARYDHSLDSETISYSHSPSDQIGSVGYGGLVGRDGGTAQAALYASYTGNRFDASVSHSTSGSDLGHIGSEQATTVRVGTTIAFADGAFGVGRRITDSFAVLYPNANLQGRTVVAGQSLSKNDYMGESGPLGGALNSYLASYTIQTVQYDVKNPPLGYDIGPGVVRVKPPYRSGYKIKVGSDAFVSVMGTLVDAGGAPVALAGGRVYPVGQKEQAPIAFFTNSVGRFAMQDLHPGWRYHVELFGASTGFEFDIPSDNTGLLDLKTLTMPPGN